MISNVFGLGVFFGLLYWAIRTHTYRWRLLAQSYELTARKPAKAMKRPVTIIAVGGGIGWTSYVGVTIEVGEEGLVLRSLAPTLFQSPSLFLPFNEMKVQRTSWYLNAGSFGIRMARSNGIELIVDDELRSWIQAQTAKFEIAI